MPYCWRNVSEAGFSSVGELLQHWMVSSPHSQHENGQGLVLLSPKCSDPLSAESKEEPRAMEGDGVVPSLSPPAPAPAPAQ